jgi:hypothetical protein
LILEKNLKKNLNLLKDESCRLIEESLCNYFRVVNLNLSEKKVPFELNVSSSKKIIYDSISKISSFQLNPRYSFSFNHFDDNEIKFELIGQDIPEPNDPNYIEYYSERSEIKEICLVEFWKDDKNIKLYNEIGNFDCFIDTTILLNEKNKYFEKGDIINIEGWENYLSNLLKLYFGEFKMESKSSASTVRLLKPINEDIYFGFEYNKAEYINFLKNGDIYFPEYFNLILLSNNFKKGTKKKDYVFRFNDDILSLGILGNPFFYLPVPVLESYCAYINKVIVDQSGNQRLKYFRDFKEISENRIEIIHSKEFGEETKKYALYYIATLAYTSKSYLTFLEKSIRDSIN